MKKVILIMVVVSFLFSGIAFANDDESNLPASQRTDQFTTHQNDDDGRVKALIGAERIPIVDPADIRDPNFVGDRGFVPPTTVDQDRIRGLKPPVQPAGPKSTVSPESPAAPDSSKAPSSILLDEESEKRPELTYQYENEKYRYEDSSGRVCGDSNFSVMRHVQTPARAIVPSGAVNPINQPVPPGQL
jgi:hypothetical protein